MTDSRPGTTNLQIPEAAGELVAAQMFNGRLIVACENGLYELTGDKEWRELRPVEIEETPTEDPDLLYGRPRLQRDTP